MIRPHVTASVLHMLDAPAKHMSHHPRRRMVAAENGPGGATLVTACCRAQGAAPTAKASGMLELAAWAPTPARWPALMCTENTPAPLDARAGNWLDKDFTDIWL